MTTPRRTRRPWPETEARVRQLLAEEPGITGKEVGRRIGVSANHGQSYIRRIGRPRIAVAVVERFPGLTLSQRYPHLMLPVARIELTRGLHAIVDPEDLEYASQYKWFADKQWYTWYAKTNIRRPAGVRAGYRTSSLRLHVLIAGTSGVDHVNGNGLDNRRVNLRPANNGQQILNRGKRQEAGRPNSSRFKGVSRKKGKWAAGITVDRKCIHLGTYTEEEDAARAYDQAAVAYFGEYAKTNEMLGLYAASISGHGTAA